MLPSLFCGIFLFFYYFIPLGDSGRVDYVFNLLLAIVLFLLVIIE